MESRVGELDLRVRAPAGRADAIVPAARDFVCRVLERCDALLEERAPGRLVFMRQVDMQWRVWQRGLGSGDEVEAVAAEMASALDEDVRARTRSADESDVIAVFADEVQYRAEYLRAVSRQRAGSCWFFGPLLDEGPPPGLLVRREHRVLTEAVVLRLVADGRLEEVLSELPATVVAGLAAALDVAEPIAADRETSDTLSPAQRVLAAFVQRGTPSTRTSPPQADHLSPAADRFAGADPLSTPAEPATDRAVDSPVPVGREHTNVADTKFGGLFYLLAPALELSMGEALWRACVSEAAVFARIAAALLGSAASDDPAPRLFASSTSPPKLTAVAGEQHAEIANAILAASIVALTRYGVTALPPVHLSVTAGASGRLLVATASESPFALFAWPARSRDALREGLAALLARWPANAPIVAERADSALASLDRTGRIRTTRAVSPRPWLLPHDDPYSTALLTQAAGALAFLFAARTGDASLDAPQLTERYLTIPARVLISTDLMEISMPMERIDLAVRGGGLDRDPGWVPWLQRRVRFVFGGHAASLQIGSDDDG